MPRPLLFCNIGWMRDYQGQTDTDKIVGGGKYVKLKKRGEEVCNFVAARGVVYGYVQPVGDQIKLEKLGAPSAAQSISGVDVVVTALRPGGGSVVVGWFRDATVYRHLQGLRHPTALHKKNGVKWFRYEASASNVTLLHPDRRTLSVPRGKGGMGNSNVWYAPEVSASFLARVRRLIASPDTAPAKARGRRTAPDHLKNAEVEDAAMKHVWAHYVALDYEMEDVSDRNLGWDLEATSDAVKLCIEVKGLSGDVATVSLTPNEYQAFEARSVNYRLCVVTDCLTKPALTTCSFNPANGRWIIEAADKRRRDIDIKERTAAFISLF